MSFATATLLMSGTDAQNIFAKNKENSAKTRRSKNKRKVKNVIPICVVDFTKSKVSPTHVELLLESKNTVINGSIAGPAGCFM